MFYYKYRRTIILFSGLILLLILIGFSYGYLTRMSDKRPPDDSGDTAEEAVNPDQEDAEETGDMAREVSKTGPGSLLVLRRYYTRCQHTITEEMAMDTRDIGKTGEELSLAFPAWRLVRFTPERVVFAVEVDGYCPDHYIIREEGGYLVVYRPEKETGELTPVEETNIPYDWLTPEMQKQVDAGLVVDTLEDVERLMENWES